MRGTNNTEAQAQQGLGIETVAARPGMLLRQTTELPRFTTTGAGSARIYGSGRGVNDGVFANLNAKPEVGEKEEQPPVRKFHGILLPYISFSLSYLEKTNHYPPIVLRTSRRRRNSPVLGDHHSSPWNGRR
jgi:hypothetical protein